MRNRSRVFLLSTAVTVAAVFAPGCSGGPQSGEWTDNVSSGVLCESVGPGVHLAACVDPLPGGGIHLPPSGIHSSPPSGPTGPVTLASGLTAPLGIAVDAFNVYYGDVLGNVRSVPIGGGAPITLATEQGAIYGLAADYQSFSPTIARPDFNLSASGAVYWASLPTVAGISIKPETGAPVGAQRVAGPGSPPSPSLWIS